MNMNTTPALSEIPKANARMLVRDYYSDGVLSFQIEDGHGACVIEAPLSELMVYPVSGTPLVRFEWGGHVYWIS